MNSNLAVHSSALLKSGGGGGYLRHIVPNRPLNRTNSISLMIEISFVVVFFFSILSFLSNTPPPPLCTYVDLESLTSMPSELTVASSLISLTLCVSLESPLIMSLLSLLLVSLASLTLELAVVAMVRGTDGAVVVVLVVAIDSVE